MATAIFIVYGDEIKDDMTNVEVVETNIIPNVGEYISLSRGTYIVLKKIVDYKQVEAYIIGNPERGEERIFIFV